MPSSRLVQEKFATSGGNGKSRFKFVERGDGAKRDPSFRGSSRRLGFVDNGTDQAESAKSLEQHNEGEKVSRGFAL